MDRQDIQTRRAENQVWNGSGAYLIMVCVGIYAVLVQNIAVGDDITVAIWECMGYTVLLCYTLFKTGSLAKSLFGAH